MKFVLNETSYFGAGAIDNIPAEMQAKGLKKAFVCTDESLVKFKVTDKVLEVLKNAGIEYKVFSKIQPNPTVANVKNGLKALNKSGADVIIAVGGGSVIDTAKAIGIIKTNPEFEDVVSLDGTAPTQHKSFPLFACPTTSGTAAEVTINYVITDTKRHKKMVCVDPNDIPVVSFIDANLMVSMPKSITSSTGMDALTHAIECVLTKSANQMSDMFALEAIKIIANNLKKAYDNGADIEAREQMAYAQYVAGMGFSNVGLGIVHSLAHPLGARFDVAHGLANAILLPTVMKYNMKSDALPKYRLIAKAFGIESDKLSDKQIANKVIKAVEKLKVDVGITERLTDFGIKEKDLKVLAQDAYNDICTGGNPRETSVEDMIELYKEVY